MSRACSLAIVAISGCATSHVAMGAAAIAVRADFDSACVLMDDRSLTCRAFDGSWTSSLAVDSAAQAIISLNSRTQCVATPAGACCYDVATRALLGCRPAPDGGTWVATWTSFGCAVIGGEAIECLDLGSAGQSMTPIRIDVGATITEIEATEAVAVRTGDVVITVDPHFSGPDVLRPWSRPLPHDAMLFAGQALDVCVLEPGGRVRCVFDPIAEADWREVIASDAVMVDTEGGTGVALLNDGTVVTWQPGGAATPVPGLTGIVEVTAGLAFACARADQNSIWCWGANAEPTEWTLR